MTAPAARRYAILPPAEREAAVERHLEAIMGGEGFPAIAKQVSAILAWLNDERTSVSEVADVVLKEYGLTLKVLKTANSTYYNRWGTSALTATHAIALIGAKTIRDLVVGLMLFEHYQRKSPGLRELMLLSMLSANHARELANRLHYPSPEEAYLCGMFRNLGEVLIACHFPREYAEVLALAEEERIPAGLAALKVLGFPFEELGQALCRRLGMANIAAVMAPGAAQASPLGAITALSHELTIMAYRHTDGRPDPALAGLLEKYRPTLPVTSEQFAEVVQAGLAETRQTASDMGVSLDALRYENQVSEALTVLGHPLAARKATPAGGVALNGTTATSPAVVLEDEADPDGEPSDLRLEPGFDFDAALEQGLRGLARAGRYERVLFSLLTPSRHEVVGRLGWGERIDELVGQFRFPATSRTSSLGVAMLDRRDLFVTGTMRGDDRQLASTLGAGAFAVLPIVLEDALIGCLYADRRSEGALDDRARALVLHWRRQVERALERRHLARRALPPPPAPEAPTAPVTPLAPDPHSWSPEERRRIVLRLMSGEPADALAASTGLPAELLTRWRDQALAAAMGALG